MAYTFSKKMKIKSHLILAVILLVSSVARADTTSKIDDTVAAGIVFKISYLLGCHGPWKDVAENSPESFRDTIKVIRNDLTSFSDTESGRDLKVRAENLISFMQRVTTAKDDGADGEAFIRSLELDPKNIEQIKLAQIVTDKISEFAKTANVPSWVIEQNEEREQAAPSNR
jgi:hypothetical protein